MRQRTSKILPSDIDTSSLQVKSILNSDFWDESHALYSRIRFKILDIVDDFMRFANIKFATVDDVVLTGSICNYNWSSFSDVDVHIICDFGQFETDNSLLKDYFYLKKNEWNNDHDDLNMFGHKVELYVEDSHDKAVSGGIYSLYKNKWLKEPSKPQSLSGHKLERVRIIVSDIMNQINSLYQKYEQTTDDVILDKLWHNSKKLLNNIRSIRSAGLMKYGEFSIGNCVYKLLRRTKYLDKLWNLSIIIYDEMNSVE